jgi:3-phosphoshikimate 1-carboxyvinyltransferase
MFALGVPLRAVGTAVELDPAGWSGKMEGFPIDIPGDVSAAAFLVVAAQITEGSRITIRGVGVNPTRVGLLEISRHMGAGLEIVPQGGSSVF